MIRTEIATAGARPCLQTFRASFSTRREGNIPRGCDTFNGATVGFFRDQETGMGRSIFFQGSVGHA